MISYFIRRFLLLIPVLLGVSFMTFGIAKLTPGDPARMMAGKTATQETIDRLHKQLGLDDPFLVQYGRFLWKAVQGDFGVSYRGQKSVINSIMSRFPSTAELALTSLALVIVTGIPLGMLAARFHGTWFDKATLFFTTTLLSLPLFWIAIVFLYFFGVWLKWINVTGEEGIKGLILPAVCMAMGSSAYITRITRSSILETWGEDYVRTARSKGLAEKVVMNRHVLRNALIPVITLLGMMFAGLLGGAVFVENVFARSGLGRFMIQAISARDLPEITGSVLFLASIFVLCNIVVDFLYAVIDPRIRYT